MTSEREELARVNQSADALDWKSAAMRLGENLPISGPDGYYDFTPTKWLNWAIDALRQQAQPEQPSVVAVEKCAEIRRQAFLVASALCVSGTDAATMLRMANQISSE